MIVMDPLLIDGFYQSIEENADRIDADQFDHVDDNDQSVIIDVIINNNHPSKIDQNLKSKD